MKNSILQLLLRKRKRKLAHRKQKLPTILQTNKRRERNKYTQLPELKNVGSESLLKNKYNKQLLDFRSRYSEDNTTIARRYTSR